MPATVRDQRDSILMINEVLKSDEPIHVHVSEKDDEEVEVFIG
jgi:cytosine/adenosine deaminase-related metal-dependent hydrolase